MVSQAWGITPPESEARNELETIAPETPEGILSARVT